MTWDSDVGVHKPCLGFAAHNASLPSPASCLPPTSLRIGAVRCLLRLPQRSFATGVGLREKIKMQAVRAAVLKRMRVGVAAPWVQAPVFTSGFRLFSSEAQGTYLDKHVVTDRVLSVVKKMQKVDTAKVIPSAHFQNDLGLDSLDTVEVVMAFEEEFAIEIPDADADKILSCADAIDYIASQPRAK